MADTLVILAVQWVLALRRLAVLHLLHILSRYRGEAVVLHGVEQVVSRHGELGHDTGPEFVPTAQRLIVHLRRRDTVADVVLMEEG